MRRGVAELGARTQLCVEQDDASGWRGGGADNLACQLQTFGDGIAGIPQAALENAQSNASVLKSMPHRFDLRDEPGSAANRAGRGQRLGDAQAAAECEHGKRSPPEPGAELPALGDDDKGNGETQGHKQRTQTGLPLGTQDEPSQPSRRDPRQHETWTSK